MIGTGKIRGALDMFNPSSLKRSAGRDVWAVGDQVLVSGMNFVTGILVVRLLGLKSYGIFVGLNAIVLYAWAWALALLISPLLTLAPQIVDEDERRDYLLGMNTAQLLFAVASAAVVGVATASLRTVWHAIPAGTTWSLCITTFAYQAQDGLRRFYFAQRRGKSALLNDVVSYGGQVLLLLAFARAHRASPNTALWAIGLSSLAAVAVGAVYERLLGSFAAARRAAQRSWKMGRDLFVSTQMNWANSQGLLLIASALIGAEAAGLIRAAQIVTGPFNVLFQSMDNIVPVRASICLANNGRAGLTRFCTRALLVFGAFLLLPCLGIAGFSGLIVKLATGASSAMLATLIVWQCVYMYQGLFFRIGTYFLRTIARTDVIVVATTLLLIISIGTTVAMASRWGALAVTAGMVMGQAAAIVYVGIRILRLSRSDRKAALPAVPIAQEVV
jgi:O-antigen/teichoic acid export membrane protein